MSDTEDIDEQKSNPPEDPKSNAEEASSEVPQQSDDQQNTEPNGIIPSSSAESNKEPNVEVTTSQTSGASKAQASGVEQHDTAVIASTVEQETTVPPSAAESEGVLTSNVETDAQVEKLSTAESTQALSTPGSTAAVQSNVETALSESKAISQAISTNSKPPPSNVSRSSKHVEKRQPSKPSSTVSKKESTSTVAQKSSKNNASKKNTKGTKKDLGSIPAQRESFGTFSSQNESASSMSSSMEPITVNSSRASTASKRGKNKSAISKDSKVSKDRKRASRTSNISSTERMSSYKSSNKKEGGSYESCERRASTSRGASRSRTKMADVNTTRIGFVGAGRMTESICKGLLKTEKVNPKQLFVSAKTCKNFDLFKTQGIITSTRSYDIFGKFDCDLIFLCMHGFVIRNCFKMGGTRPFAFTTNYIPCRRKQLVIVSLVGGIPLADIRTTLLNPETPHKYQIELHRAMLNTSVAYNIGFGALDVEVDSKKCHPVLRDILHMIARIEFLDADLMDAACAISGNGLAFVYHFLSALADGGFKMGLNKSVSVKLAAKALQASALVVLESNKGPQELLDSSTSPNSPILYGITLLEKQECGLGIQSAIETSYKRIKDLVEKDH